MLVLLHLVRWCWLTPKYPQVSSSVLMTRSLRETKSREFCFWHLLNITQDPWKPLDRRNSQEELQPKDPKVLEKSARPREKTRGPSWGDVRRKLGLEVKKLKGKLIEMFEPQWWHKVWSCSQKNDEKWTCYDMFEAAQNWQRSKITVAIWPTHGATAVRCCDSKPFDWQSR